MSASKYCELSRFITRLLWLNRYAILHRMAIPTMIQPYLDELQRNSETVGILLFGSWARGNNRPDSDIDLLVIVTQGFKRRAESHDGRGHLSKRPNMALESTASGANAGDFTNHVERRAAAQLHRILSGTCGCAQGATNDVDHPF